MKTPKISGALATHNEEENVFDCIESLKQFTQEVIVADGASSDRTVEIAVKLGAKVIKTTNKPMFHINKNMAIHACSGDWIFLIDADERISAQLATEIKEVVKKNPPENGFWVPRANWFLGDFLTKGGAYPDNVIRLFRKGKGILPQVTVHEQVKIEGEIGHLKNNILHLADPTFSRYLARANRYTTQTAQEIEEEDPGRGVFTLLYYAIIKPSVVFLKIFLRHRGYADGLRGFIWAFFSGFHYFFAYIKYFSKNSSYR